MSKLLVGSGSHLALAIVCSKACIPLKVPLAAALTPYVYRCTMRPHGYTGLSAGDAATAWGRRLPGWTLVHNAVSCLCTPVCLALCRTLCLVLCVVPCRLEQRLLQRLRQ